MLYYAAYQNKDEKFEDVAVVETDVLIDLLQKAKQNGDQQIILCGSIIGTSENQRIVDLDKA